MLFSPSVSFRFIPSCNLGLVLIIMWSASVFHVRPWTSWGRESPSNPLPEWITSTSGKPRQAFANFWAWSSMFLSMSPLKILKKDTRSSTKFKCSASELSMLLFTSKLENAQRRTLTLPGHPFAHLSTTSVQFSIIHTFEPVLRRSHTGTGGLTDQNRFRSIVVL